MGVSLALLSPLLLFIAVLFIGPLLSMLYLSIKNDEEVTALPRTVEAIKSWTSGSLPGEPVYAALVEDLRAAGKVDRSILGNLARRLNFEIVGFRSLLLYAPNKVANLAPPYKEALITADPGWGHEEYWRAIQRNASPITAYYYLTALDLKRDDSGTIVAVDQPIFWMVFFRTFWMSALITAICVLIAYPVAFTLAMMPARVANLLMFFVLLPFWTSILVRTSAWIVLLETHGVINDTLQRLQLTSGPLSLLFNKAGVIIAMVHVMLPFMILPIYSVMRGVNPNLVRAAYSLGASSITAFRRVYLPQTVPGISAGCTLVFILTLGYYITPQLVGGPKDQLISSFIADYTSQYLNWGLASALASILLVVVFLVFVVFQKRLRIQGTIV
jgi:putative spermidine/putrescine transport system permease protein